MSAFAEAHRNPLEYYISGDWTEDPCPEATSYLSPKTGSSNVVRDDSYDRSIEVPEVLCFRSVDENDLRDLDQIGSVAVHLHLFYPDMLDEMLESIENIPVPFDLFVSTAMDADRRMILDTLNERFPHARIEVAQVVNRGRDLAPFFVEFGKELIKYDFVCHLHSKRSLHKQLGDVWRKYLLKSILGSPYCVYQILRGMSSYGCGLSYPQAHESVAELIKRNGWGSDNEFFIAQELSNRLGVEKPSSKTFSAFPAGSFFWITSDVLRSFVELDWKVEDFDEEQGQIDGTLAHVVERMLGYFNNKSGLKSLVTINQYEEARPLSQICDVAHSKPRIIAFHLPQFYSFPENDEWWGKGFTEWTNVKATRPLFPGHEQPRFPHPDIGYYRLDKREGIEQQAKLAKEFGIHGFCYYYYWFGGRRLMEKPLDIILSDPSIDLNYCLCWANEGWTRSWDGNENHVLMAQEYSAANDLSFIEDLSLYFEDPRYIRIDEKPILIVYRWDLFPDMKATIERWRKWCADSGIGEIFITTCSIRGIEKPINYGFDGIVERPLYDWEQDKIPDRSKEYHVKDEGKGVVYNYSNVASHYKDCTIGPDSGTVFRSLPVMWDPSPRHSISCHIVTDNDPKIYERWLSQLLANAEKIGDDDNGCVFVNAWNEWAEGAYLEPDCRRGYAMLNSTSRALLGGWPWEGFSFPSTRSSERILILEHGGGGGAERFLESNLIPTFSPDDWLVRISVAGEALNVSIYEAGEKLDDGILADVDLKRFLELVGFTKVYFNNIVGSTDSVKFVKLVTEYLSTADAESIFFAHDYFPLCPSVNLLSNEMKYCGLPTNVECERCYKENTNIPLESYPNKMHKWREVWSDLFANIGKIVLFSNDSYEHYANVFGDFREKMVVTPHPIPNPLRRPLIKRSAQHGLKLGVIGGINFAKGGAVIEALAGVKSSASGELSLIGYTVHELPDNVHVTGPYNVSDLPDIIEQLDINLFIVPSVVPETFCFALSELMGMLVPVVCFDLGAQANRVREYEFGKVLPRSLIEEPERLWEELNGYYLELYT